MKTLYLECNMGAAGDMLTAALLELHPDPVGFVERLNALDLPGVCFRAEKTVKCGITGTHMAVTVNGQEEESLDTEHVHEHSHEHGHQHDHDHSHEHEHDHHDECECGCHEHHGHHHADEIFTSWGKQTSRKFSKTELSDILSALDDNKLYGDILRAKGIVPSSNGDWLHFDYVPGQADIRNGQADITGRICVIGAKINEKELEKLFS